MAKQIVPSGGALGTYFHNFGIDLGSISVRFGLEFASIFLHLGRFLTAPSSETNASKTAVTNTFAIHFGFCFSTCSAAVRAQHMEFKILYYLRFNLFHYVFEPLQVV